MKICKKKLQKFEKKLEKLKKFAKIHKKKWQNLKKKKQKILIKFTKNCKNQSNLIEKWKI